MSRKVTAFVEGLISYDYILFSSSFVLFIVFIILSIVFRKKLTIAIVFVLLGFFILLLGPTVGYIQMHNYLFKNSIVLESQQKLSFTEAIVVKGKLTNDSKFDFSTCEITANVYKVTKNKYRNYLLKFKPFQKSSMFTPAILKGESYDFKLFIEPFRYSKEYNISLGADCK
jgi:uncharacterized protein DUF2393